MLRLDPYIHTNFTTAAGMTTVGTTNKGTKSFKVSGLTQGTTYYFAVVPVDNSGNSDSTVHTASAIPTDTAAPEEVTSLSATAGYNSMDGNYITVKWTASLNSTGDLADQVVYLDNGSGYDTGTPIGKTATTYKKTNLNDATKYRFKITTKDTGGHESSGVAIDAVTRLNNPTNLASTPGNGKVTLTWSPVSSAYVKNYNIYRITSNAQQLDVTAMTLIKTISTSTTSYTDSGLINGTTYQYAVTVINTFGAERIDVKSIGAAPRGDTTGPVISGLNITQNQVISAPVTITASAADTESSMDRLEVYIDNTLVKGQTGSSISYFWNVVDAADGNHSIKINAYDSLGNASEISMSVVVSLAPPSAPAITGHTKTATTPQYLVTVNGTAPLFTTMSLRVNGSVVGWAVPTDTAGKFFFTSIPLVEGDNLISAKATHRGGESAWSPDYKITVDTGAPTSPVTLAAKALAGGTLQFTWQAGTGEVPTGYNLYVSNSSFTSKTDAGVTKANTSPISYTFREYIPADDNKKYYAVTALDGAGNESAISNIISLTSDRTSPTLASERYTFTDAAGTVKEGATLAGPGTVKVMITISEPLSELPFFSLEPVDGSPIVLSLKKVDETHYEGTFTVNTSTPHGPTSYKFSGKDIVGNRGNAQGAGIAIDVKGPDATIQTPLNIQQIKPEPVQASIVFNEPSVTTPILELKATDGTIIQINGLTTSDNGIHWTGTTDISAMPEGKTEFILKEAKDKLGNTGATVTSGRYILLYKDKVPSPGVPTDLAAKSGKGGIITLAWTPVTSKDINVNITYNLYRRGENETEAVKIKTGIPGSPAQDTPPTDGTYYYSLTAVGLLNTEGEKTGEIQAASDRTGPGAPVNPFLSFDSRGIVAAWTIPSGETPASYNLYRSEAPITTTQGLTPTAYTKTTNAVDTSPAKTYRYYAITALDALGNEGPLSESREITYPVSPVRNLILQRIETAAPVITWEAPADSGIIGYHIYRNGSRITQTPTLSTSYTDGYYSSGTVTYGISAIDSLNNESPVKEVKLSDFAIGLKQGTILRRGLLENIPIVVTTGQSLSIDTVDVKVGSAPSSILPGPFVLDANSTLQIEKVASTTTDALSSVSVTATAGWSPSPGVTVKIIQTSTAEVTGSGTALEVFSDPLIRGTNTKIRLKVNNLGTAQMEFLTSENSAETHKVKVNLRDQDGNLLSTGYLNQRTGSAIVNAGSYAVARLNPNETVTTEPVMLPVPQSAPSRVVIEAVIDNTYYHYNKPDQVTAPGMGRSFDVTISETPYRATAAPEKTFYSTSQPVIITGQAIDNTTNNPVPNVPVKLGISVKGFDRYFTATTDSNGNFTYTFAPGANESGNYSVWAVHPDVTTRTVQSTFTIAGLSISPITANVKMLKNKTIDIPVTINNYGEAPLTGLRFTTVASTGITAEVINPGDNTLTAGEQAGVTLRLTASSNALDTSTAALTIDVNEGLHRRLDAMITLVSAIPVIATSPSYIDTGIVRGNQKVQTFTVTNTGMETLRNARIEGPSLTWLSLTTNKTIGDIQPGSSANTGIIIKPSETIPQGVYDDRITIYADNHIPYTYNIQVTVTSSAIGNERVRRVRSTFLTGLEIEYRLQDSSLTTE